ncbi:MAG: AbrB/MazE/SpoVT family DNA-binding domain-containing protein [Acidimicrobiales bacterium]
MPQTPSAEVAVGPQGRLVIPAKLRRALGIGPGSILLAHIEGRGRLVLEDRATMVRGRTGSWTSFAPGRSLSEELIAERHAQQAAEDAG